MQPAKPFRPRFFAATIFFAAVIAFWPALRNDFVHDDRIQVQEITLPATPAQWLAAPAQPWWPPSHHKNLWRPFTRVTILLQKAVHDNVGWPYFAVNILLHAAASILLWRLARRVGMSDAAAFLAGVVFAIHPIHAEAVHQIVGRAEILGCVWILVGLLAYDAAKAPAPQLAIQSICFALALASKESAVVYPFLLALLMIGQSGFACLRKPRFWIAMGLLGCVLALFLAGKAAVTGGLIEPASSVPVHENPLARMDFMARLPAGLGIFLYATSQLIIPIGLCPDYSAVSLPVDAGWRWPFAWAGTVFVLALAAWVIRNARAGKRGWLVPAAALGAWLPLSNILFPIGVVTAERLWYLPSAAACLGLGWLLAQIWSVKQIRSARLLPAALLASWFFTSLIYARAWRTQAEYAFWTIRRFPESWRGHVNMSREFYRVQHFEDGYTEAKKSVELMPGNAVGWSWLGVNAAFMGQPYWAQSEAALRRALELDPDFAEPHQQLATLYQIQGRRADAIRELEIYLKSGQAIDPNSIRGRIEKLGAKPGPGRNDQN
ncbi:MAG: glycosyltransferase family 39 protein [Candidatus Sumerlaeia bacterium]